MTRLSQRRCGRWPPCALGLAIGIGALGIARGHGDLFGRAVLRDGGGGALRVGAIVTAAAAGAGIFGFALAFATTVLASEILFTVWVARRGWLPLRAGGDWDRGLVAGLAPFALLQIVQQGVQWFDTLALGWLAAPAAVGVYSVARGTARVLELAAEAAAHRFLPAATMILAREGSGGLAPMFAQTRAFVFCLLWPPLAVCLLLPGELLGRVFGAEYGAGGPSLRLLALALLLSALLGYPDKALLAAGQAAVTSRWTTLGLLAGGIVALVAIPHWGALGAAAGYATMALGQRVGQAASLRRQLGVTLFDRELPGTLLRTLPLPLVLLALPGSGPEGGWWALVATGATAGLGSLWTLARLERRARGPSRG